MKKLLVLILALSLNACVTRSFRPPLNVEQTVTAGSVIVEWKRSSGFIRRNHLASRLIYLGSTGDVLRVGYREFVGDLARPAFSNELTYDTSKTKTVRYEDIAFEVKDFDSNHVRYEVTAVPEGFAEAATRK